MKWNNVIAFIVAIAVIGGLGLVHDETTAAQTPWNQDNITVNVTTGPNVNVSQAAEYDSSLNATLTYWEQHDEQNGNYTANWTVVEGEADLTVHYVSEIDSCGWDVAILGEFAGCSPILTSDMDIDHRQIEILADRPRYRVEQTLKHEFGHIYGLNHSDEPQPLMNGTVERYD